MLTHEQREKVATLAEGIAARKGWKVDDGEKWTKFINDWTVRICEHAAENKVSVDAVIHAALQTEGGIRAGSTKAWYTSGDVARMQHVDGLSLREIARRLGYSREAVIRRLKDDGLIKPRAMPAA